MTNTCETDEPHSHPPDDSQCTNYHYFVTVLRAGNETELKRLCHLLHDPGPFMERYLRDVMHDPEGSALTNSKGTKRRKSKKELESERKFLHIAGNVMLCEEGDPMFTALVTAAGGLNMRTLAANIKNKPPNEIMASMGKGDGDSGSGLSDDDWDELVALGPYLSWAWNYWGPHADRSNPMDYYT